MPSPWNACPLCGTVSGPRDRWLGGSIWARWACPGCGRVLRFDARRRTQLLMVCGLIVCPLALAMLCGLMRVRPLHLEPPWLVAFAAGSALAAKVAIFSLLDRIEVATDSDPGICRTCGYDIRVQRANMRTHCPECGQRV